MRKMEKCTNEQKMLNHILFSVAKICKIPLTNFLKLSKVMPSSDGVCMFFGISQDMEIPAYKAAETIGCSKQKAYKYLKMHYEKTSGEAYRNTYKTVLNYVRDTRPLFEDDFHWFNCFTSIVASTEKAKMNIDKVLLSAMHESGYSLSNLSLYCSKCKPDIAVRRFVKRLK